MTNNIYTPYTYLLNSGGLNLISGTTVFVLQKDVLLKIFG